MKVEPIEFVKEQIKRKIPFTEPLLRPGSFMFNEYMVEARNLWKRGEYDTESIEEAVLLESDIGEVGLFEGESVQLDFPLREKYEDEELDKPKRGGRRKFYVFTKGKGGKIVKVQFGQPGMTIKIDDPEAVKSFVARHKCSEKTDKTSAGWWSCNLPSFAGVLGIKNPNGEKYW